MAAQNQQINKLSNQQIYKIISLLTHPLVYLLVAIFYLPGFEMRVRWIAFGELVLLPAALYGLSFLIKPSGTIFAPGRFARIAAISGFIMGIFLFQIIPGAETQQLQSISRGMIALVILLVIFFLFTLPFIQISIHTAGLGSLIVPVLYTKVFWAIPVLCIVIPVVTISRIKLKAHSNAELLAGFLAGAIIPFLILISLVEQH